MWSLKSTGARPLQVLAIAMALATVSFGRLAAQATPSTSTGGHSMSGYKKPADAELKQKL
jgi:hypothetical protein